MATLDKSKPVKLDDLAMKVGGRYRLATMVAKRAKQIVQGSMLHPDRKKDDPVRKALGEIEESKIGLTPREKPLGPEDEEEVKNQDPFG